MEQATILTLETIGMSAFLIMMTLLKSKKALQKNGLEGTSFIQAMNYTVLAIIEEIIFRLFLISAIANIWGVDIAIAINAIFFSLAHIIASPKTYGLRDVPFHIIVGLLYGICFRGPFMHALPQFENELGIALLVLTMLFILRKKWINQSQIVLGTIVSIIILYQADGISIPVLTALIGTSIAHMIENVCVDIRTHYWEKENWLL